MKKVFSTSEPLIEPVGKTNVMACGDAVYDDNTKELVVYLKLSNSSGAPEIVRTQSAKMDASDTARDIFRSWVHRLVKEGTLSIEGA